MNINRAITAALLSLAAMLASAGCGRLSIDAAGAKFGRQIEWAGRGVWLKADTHTHTKFSDGAHTVAEVADQAARYGCDVLAITDHADRDLAAGTHEYIEAINEARRQHPDLVLLAGLEWNIPPYGGDEHVVVLVPPGPAQGLTLADFKARFDDLGREQHDAALADEALEWLASQAADDGVQPVAVYEHPGRKRESGNQILGDVRRWRAVNDILVGLSGAPGHQGMNPNGAYKSRLKTVRRWDPTVANVGDAWDTLLEKGIDVWAAYAPSDFHDEAADGLGDYWPGQFSETWLYAPDRTPQGALRALRAGSFFGVHGHIVREVELSVEAEGLPRAAVAGESIEVPTGTQVTVTLRCQLPDKDWSGRANRIDLVELIAVTQTGAEVVAEQAPARDGAALTATLDVPDGGFVLRGRGGSHDLMFYTNPVRVRAESGASAASRRARAGDEPATDRGGRSRVFSAVWWENGVACSLALGCLFVAGIALLAGAIRGIDALRAVGRFGIGTGLLATAEVLSLQVASLPYNVRELFAATPLTPLAIAASLIATGWLAMYFARQWRQRPLGFVWRFPLLLVAASAAMYALLRSTIPLESLHDIVGSPVLDIGYEWEMRGRFAGLYAGVVSGLTLGARVALAAQWRRSWAGLLVVGAMAFVSYSVVVLAACTDNIVELLRGDGNAVAGIALFACLACFGFSAAEAAKTAARRGNRVRSLATLLLVLSLAYACGWWLLVAATTPELDKYDTKFSAIQFLLGPDRSHHLSLLSLVIRFLAVQLGATFFLGWGMSCATRRSDWIGGGATASAGPQPRKAGDMVRQRSAIRLASPRRGHYAMFLLGFVAFAIYGSLVPLDFHALSWAEAWSRFRDIPYLHLSVASRADWVANILLFVPIGYCGLAALTCDRRSILGSTAAAVLVAASCVALSVALEFTQTWFPPRTVSQNDIVAESIGSIVGVALWSLIGRGVTAWLRSLSARTSPRERLDGLLQAYVAGLCLYSLFPLDVTINPNELRQKYDEGKLIAVPFARHPLNADDCISLISDVLIYVPVGMFMVRIFSAPERPWRSLGRGWLLGMGLAAGIKLAQVFVYSRFTDTTQLVCAAVGVAAGAKWRQHRLLAGEVVRPVSAAERRRSAALWLCAAAGYAALLAFVYIYPFPLIEDAQRIARRCHRFFGVPLASLYWESEYHALTQVLRDWLLFAPLGAAGVKVASLTGGPKHRRLAVLSGCLTLAFLLRFGIEIAEIWRDQTTATFTEVLFGTFGALAGASVTRWLMLPSRPVPDFAANHDRRFPGPVPVHTSTGVPSRFEESGNRLWASFARSGELSTTTALASPSATAVWRWRTAFLLAGGLLATGGALWAGTSLLDPGPTPARVVGNSRKRAAAVPPVDTRTPGRTAPRHPAAAPRLQRIELPHVPGESAIWGATGRDDRGHIWFGVSCWPGRDASAHLFELTPETGDVIDRGDVLSELKRARLYRPGESQQKIHSKIVQAAGYLYFSSMDESGEKEDGSRLPDWGSHLWRLRLDDDHWEHLLAAPEGLIAVAAAGRHVYALGYFDHVLHQYNIDTGKKRSVRTGALGGHISRNFFCDERDHVYVPRLARDEGPRSPVAASLLELDADLHELARSPLVHYLPGDDLLSHGIVGVQALDDRSIVFVTHVGYLYRIVPRAGGAAEVQPLGWFHPGGQHYVASLFAYPGSRYLMGAAEGRPCEWVVFDLVQRRSSVAPLSETQGLTDVGLYGCTTQDDEGNFYLAGTHAVRVAGGPSRSEPIVLKAQPPQ
ncbi:MAG TPA: VanZ family protein [Pirellulales bacterium]|nr:VanZ family protein [Pirellulales bacterium]